MFALSIPFWLIGSVMELQLLPGLPVRSLACGSHCDPRVIGPITAIIVTVVRGPRTLTRGGADRADCSGANLQPVSVLTPTEAPPLGEFGWVDDRVVCPRVDPTDLLAAVDAGLSEA